MINPSDSRDYVAEAETRFQGLNGHAVLDAPIPLVPELAPPEDYPSGALGDVLGEAANAIARKVQLPIEIAAQSVLAVASLAAQTHADIKLPYGQTRPLSLYLTSVAATGDRKTSADHEAMRPIRDHEDRLRHQYEQEHQTYLASHGAWSGEKRKIEAIRKLDYAGRKAALIELGAEPLPPLLPILTAPEPTVEGLAKCWVNAPASLGLFSAEGGQFIGGYGMAPDNRLKTAAAYSELWDGQPVKRIRAGDGATFLNGRRLAIHIMIQPAVAIEFLSNATLRDQGLLSRMLVAMPQTLAGQRLYRPTSVHEDATLQTYTDTVQHLVDRPWPLSPGKRNELVPKQLTMEGDAEQVWREFYNDVEVRSGPVGELWPVRDFAGKAAEHAARIAGVLTIINSANSDAVTGYTMSDAVALVNWYIGEALRVSAAAMIDPKVARASRLLAWLEQRSDVPQDGVSTRYVMRHAPPELRTKASAEGAMGVLRDHGWLVNAEKKDRWILFTAAGSGTTATSATNGAA